MKARVGYHPRLYILLIFIYLVNVGLLYIFSISSNFYGIRVSEKYFQNAMDAEVLFISQEISHLLGSLNTMLYNTCNETLIIRYSWGPNSYLPVSERFQTTNNVTSYLNSIVALSGVTDKITLYLPKYQRKITSNSGERAMTDEDNNLLNTVITKTGIIYDSDMLYCTVYKSIDEKSGEDIVLTADIDRALLTEIIQRFVQDTEKEIIAIVDNSENVVIAATRSIGADGLMGVSQRGNEYISSSCTLSYEQMSIVKVRASAYLMTEAGQFRLWIIFMSAMTFITVLLFLLIVKYLIHRPIGHLVNSIEKVKAGNFYFSPRSYFVYELNNLEIRFEEMITRLREMIDREYKQQLLLENAKYKLLQMQINPHFLYNTYFIVERMINDENFEEASELSGLLGKFLQYITNDSDTVPLVSEIEYAVTYLRIQGLRFSQSVKIDIQQFPNITSEVRVPKLIIQPLIENVFKHTISEKERVKIWLHYVLSANALTIHVENSGSINDTHIAWIRSLISTEQTDESVALKNIAQRLRIFYGEDGHIGVARSQLGGLDVYINIPR